MRLIKHLSASMAALSLLAVIGAQADDKVVNGQTTQLTQLEKDIKLHDDLAADMRDSIAILDAEMEVLKAKLDSVNDVAKGIKGQISQIEKLKKEQEKSIKSTQKSRQATVETRDNLIYQQDVLPVLSEPYDKIEVENVLAKFDAMETKDVIKRKDLVNNYGKYAKDIRDFLEKQKRTFEQLRWVTQGSDSEAYKTFQKGLKGLSYYKIYEKGLKNPKTPTIPYLDEVMGSILQLQHSGFGSQAQYNRVINMLY